MTIIMTSSEHIFLLSSSFHEYWPLFVCNGKQCAVVLGATVMRCVCIFACLSLLSVMWIPSFSGRGFLRKPIYHSGTKLLRKWALCVSLFARTIGASCHGGHVSVMWVRFLGTVLVRVLVMFTCWQTLGCSHVWVGLFYFLLGHPWN